jgi:hypothetical protein
MRPVPAASSQDGQSSGECATRNSVGPFRSEGRLSCAARRGAHTGSRSAANSGSAIRPGHSPSPSLMPQLQSSPNGTAAPPVVMRTSMSGSSFRKSASRGISHRIAKVGPTPMVSTRTLAGAVTWAVRLASASKIGVSPL